MARILIIDDEAGIRETIGEVLTQDGHEVVEAVNGREGVDRFKETPADLVLTDIYMPRMGGTETIEEIKSISLETKIIAISGGGLLGPMTALQIAELRGADHVLIKPIQFEELARVIKELLG